MSQHPSAEAVARVAKASALAEVLEDVGCSADEALLLSDGGWASAAAVAAERRGRLMAVPSDATRSLVVDLLRARAAS